MYAPLAAKKTKNGRCRVSSTIHHICSNDFRSIVLSSVCTDDEDDAGSAVTADAGCGSCGWVHDVTQMLE